LSKSVYVAFLKLFKNRSIRQESEQARQDLTERRKALGKDRREGSKTVGEEEGKKVRKGMISNLQ